MPTKNLTKRLGITLAALAVITLPLPPIILPSVYTRTEIKGDEMSITKRKGLTSKVTYTHSEDKNEIEIYNFNMLSKSYGSISLKDYNQDNVVDEIYFNENPLTEGNLKIERPKDKDFNSAFFNEADKIYQEQIKRIEEIK